MFEISKGRIYSTSDYELQSVQPVGLWMKKITTFQTVKKTLHSKNHHWTAFTP